MIEIPVCVTIDRSIFPKRFLVPNLASARGLEPRCLPQAYRPKFLWSYPPTLFISGSLILPRPTRTPTNHPHKKQTPTPSTPCPRAKHLSPATPPYPNQNKTTSYSTPHLHQQPTNPPDYTLCTHNNLFALTLPPPPPPPPPPPHTNAHTTHNSTPSLTSLKMRCAL